MKLFDRYMWMGLQNKIAALLQTKTHITKENEFEISDLDNTTVILTVWKRNYLAEQLKNLLNQTEKPFQIWICHYEDHINIDWVKKKYPEINIIKSCINLKYFGRFAVGQFVKSNYIWILDDDVIPSINWLKNSKKICQEENAIVSGAGRIIPDGDYMPERMSNIDKYFFGDVTPNYLHNFCDSDTVVDFGCNGWFFKTEWIKNFWRIPPITLDIAEDMHLSATCKLLHGIKTIVPKQTDIDTSGNLNITYGRDEFASWLKPGFIEQREKVIRYLIQEKNWKPILWK